MKRPGATPMFGVDASSIAVKEFCLQNLSGKPDGDLNIRRIDGPDKRRKIMNMTKEIRVKSCRFSANDEAIVDLREELKKDIKTRHAEWLKSNPRTPAHFSPFLDAPQRKDVLGDYHCYCNAYGDHEENPENNIYERTFSYDPSGVNYEGVDIDSVKGWDARHGSDEYYVLTHQILGEE